MMWLLVGRRSLGWPRRRWQVQVSSTERFSGGGFGVLKEQRAWMVTSSSSSEEKQKDEVGVSSENVVVDAEPRSSSVVMKLARKLKWDPDSLAVDPAKANRWVMLPAATMNHVCLGSIYAWSVFNQPLMRLSGVVNCAPEDWTLGDISVTFSLVMGGFVYGAVLAKKVEEFGPRVSCLLGSASLLGGFSLASLAVQTQNLYVLYLGGLVWGMSNALAYLPPVASLIKFFPEKKGFASSACLLGYGGGAMIAAPLFTHLIDHFRNLPEYAGSGDNIVNEGGKLFVEGREVIVATMADLKSAGLADIADVGAYYVGTGSTGVAEAFACLGLLYGGVMAACSFVYRLPMHSTAGVQDEVKTHFSEKENQIFKEHVKDNISPDQAMKSPQFWLLYSGFGLGAVGVYGLISSGKLLLNEAFGSNDLVTTTFATTFVAGMSAANLMGRVFWPISSDFLASHTGGDPFYARKRIYTMMWGISPLFYGGMLWSIHESVQNPSALSLGVFCASVMGILSSFGGATANRPPIVADIFGINSMQVITARQLSVVLPAAFMGPQIVAYFRQQSTEQYIHELSAKLDDNSFAQVFGASKEELPSLIETKTVTIARLLDALPPGIPDPTALTYDNAFLVLGGMQLAALATNLALKPVMKRD